MDFDEIENGIQFFVDDRTFRAGSLCVRRTGGLPMGGALSPPLAAFDLEHSIVEALTEERLFQKWGWARRKESPFRIFQCRVYVDDILSFSHALCVACLEKTVRVLVPEDVGLEVEHRSEGAAEFPYLHTIVSTRTPTPSNPSFFYVRPLLHNERFAFGLDMFPRVAKLEVFLGKAHAKYSDLRPFVFARLVTFETTFRSCDPSDGFVEQHSKRSLVVLALESLRLRWPHTWFANVLVEFPYYRKNWFANTIRCLGLLVRRSQIIAVWCGDTSTFFHKYDASSDVAALVDIAFDRSVATHVLGLV
jgi:hypothetical protein